MKKITLQDIPNISDNYPNSTRNIKLADLKKDDKFFLVIRPSATDEYYNGNKEYYIEEYVIENTLKTNDGVVINTTDNITFYILCSDTTVWTTAVTRLSQLHTSAFSSVYGAASNLYSSTRKLKMIIEEFNELLEQNVDELKERINTINSNKIDTSCFEQM